MTRIVLALIFVVLAALAAPSAVLADVLLIEEVRQSDQMNVPVNGMTTAEVRAKFGEPEKTNPAVGDPPIKRWDYGSWSVYFEYDVVLFTVLHKGAGDDSKAE